MNLPSKLPSDLVTSCQPGQELHLSVPYSSLSCTHAYPLLQEVVDLLLRAHVDAGHVDNFGYTALYEAARMGNDDCLQLLLENKAP